MLDVQPTQKCIAIIGNGSLFDEGIAEWLTRDTSFRVSHIVYPGDGSFLNLIKRDRPDAILICESGMLGIEPILDSLSTDPIAIGLLILAIRLSHPVIEVYERPGVKAGGIPHRPRSIVEGTVNDLIHLLSGRVG
jgi:hypothetical protein